MEKVCVKFDMYALYDRMLEGVLADVELSYDAEQVIKSGINSDTVKCENVKFSVSSLRYLNAYPFNIPQILMDVTDHFTDADVLYDYVIEELTDDQYEQYLNNNPE